MKNKYFALFMAVVICFTFLFGTVATAVDIDIPPETIGGVMEGVLGRDPSEVGGEIMDGIYEGRDILQTIYDVLENIKIVLSNLINSIFSAFENLGGSSSDLIG